MNRVIVWLLCLLQATYPGAASAQGVLTLVGAGKGTPGTPTAGLSCNYTPVTSATYNVAYTGATPSASGGTPAYTFSQTGTLPPGFSINTGTGVISGTDSVDSGGATYPGLQVKVTDSLSTVVNCGASFTITVAAGGCAYLLPLGSNTVSVAYSLRKLRSAYGGNAAQLTRASDNTTQDIGFVNSCDFDATSAAAFCALTTCVGTKFYEQSGSGNPDAVVAQANAPTYTASCPTTSLPCFTWSGGSNLNLPVTISSITNATLYAVVRYTDLTTNRVPLSLPGGGTTTPVNYIGYRTSGTACSTLKNNGTTSQITQIACSVNTWYVQWGSVNTTNVSSCVSGSCGTDSTSSQAASASTHVEIGTEFTVAGTANLIGTTTDIIVFAPNISLTDVKTACRNSATYYGLTTTC